MRMTKICAFILAATALMGCDDHSHGEGNASLTVLLENGGGIFDGLVPGDQAINIKDGWSVTANKYIVTVGDVEIRLSTDADATREAGDVFVIDLTKLQPAGEPLWTFDGLADGRWEFNYRTPSAGDGSTRHDNVEQADYDAMVAADFTHWLEGELTKADGQSCPPASLAMPGSKTTNGNKSGDNDCYDAPTVRFTLGAQAETNYGPCEIDGLPGVSVTEGGTNTVAASVHGDHLFFNGFPEGDEGGVSRLAQWMVDCDLNLDGTVTKEELEAVKVTDLPEIDSRYQLGGSPITPLETMYDYLVGQLKTQGHYQGEGECPVDGVEHDHGHDHDHDH